MDRFSKFFHQLIREILSCV